MTRIDLADLPPKLAALLTAVETGEEVLLVQHGAVVGRLVGGDQPAPLAADVEALLPEENAKEIFEQFRSAIEDEF